MVIDKASSILSAEYVAAVLLYLIDKNEIICQDLSIIITSGTTRKETLIDMRDAGLVDVRTILRPRKTYFVKLTELGLCVARDLKTAADRLDGKMPEEPSTNCGAPPITGGNVRS